MTNESQSGKAGDYFHALAIRVLHEDRMPAPRRSSLFENEFYGPAEVAEFESAVPAESLPRESAPRAADGPGGFLAPGPARPASMARAVSPLEQSATRAPIMQPAPGAPATPASVAEAGARRQIAAIVPDIDQPAARSATHEIRPLPMAAPVAAMPVAYPVHVANPPPPTSQVSPRSRTSANLPAASPQSAAPQVIHEHSTAANPTLVSAAPAPSKPAPRRDSQPAALIAHAIPDMRSFAPLFPVPQGHKEPPAVEISIGRLEIRAADGKTPAVAPRSMPTTPRHTLKEYLARQRGGRA